VSLAFPVGVSCRLNHEHYDTCCLLLIFPINRFRWAICQLETVKDCLTPAMIRQELEAMPPTLDETYDRILRAVPIAHRPFVQAALHWLAFSARPMLLEELAEAVIIRPQTGHFDAESSRLLDPRTILYLCGALVTSTSTNSHEERPRWLDVKGEIETRGRQNFYTKKHVTVISLSHYTVKEYLVSPRTQMGLSFYYKSERLGNSFIAQCCLLYILDFNGGSIAGDIDYNEYPLLSYCARYWTKHWLLGGGGECDAQLGQFYERLFQPESRGAYTNWLNIWHPDIQWADRWGSYDYVKRSADLFPQPLYWVAGLGDLALVTLLVEQGADTTAREGHFESALGAAVFGGHMEVVEYFLHIGLDPDIQVVRYGSLLQLAIVGGSMPMVKRLIEAGADVNARGGELNSPLIAAASKQRDDIVALLIKHGAELNLDSEPCGSALYRAAEAGDIKLATMLLGAGADVNGSGAAEEPPPLFAAAKSGCLALVNMFIRKGADVNKGGDSEDDRYPLLAAADKGHSQIVRALLMAGADPNLKGRRGCTALEQGIGSGDLATFHTLLNAGADINACSEMYINCFQVAVKFSEFDMAKVLVERGAELREEMLVDAVAIYQREPWVLEALLTQDVNIDIFASYSGSPTTTPLHVAVMNRDGGELVAKLVLERNPYVNAIDQYHCSTPLCLAVRDGRVQIARQLIDRGADVNRTTVHSPFEMAVMHACEEGGTLELAEMLIEAGVDINGETESA
jgi:ankyrin repeat protein